MCTPPRFPKKSLKASSNPVCEWTIAATVSERLRRRPLSRLTPCRSHSVSGGQSTRLVSPQWQLAVAARLSAARRSAVRRRPARTSSVPPSTTRRSRLRRPCQSRPPGPPSCRRRRSGAGAAAGGRGARGWLHSLPQPGPADRVQRSAHRGPDAGSADLAERSAARSRVRLLRARIRIARCRALSRGARQGERRVRPAVAHPRAGGASATIRRCARRCSST